MNIGGRVGRQDTRIYANPLNLTWMENSYNCKTVEHINTDENQMDEPPRQDDTVLNQNSGKIMNYRTIASLSSKLINPTIFISMCPTTVYKPGMREKENNNLLPRKKEKQKKRTYFIASRHILRMSSLTELNPWLL
jgi:hypothetical protein